MKAHKKACCHAGKRGSNWRLRYQQGGKTLDGWPRALCLPTFTTADKKNKHTRTTHVENWLLALCNASRDLMTARGYTNRGRWRAFGSALRILLGLLALMRLLVRPWSTKARGTSGRGWLRCARLAL